LTGELHNPSVVPKTAHVHGRGDVGTIFITPTVLGDGPGCTRWQAVIRGRFPSRRSRTGQSLTWSRATCWVAALLDGEPIWPSSAGSSSLRHGIRNSLLLVIL